MNSKSASIEKIGQLNVKNFTSANLQVFKTRRIKASPTKLWETISDSKTLPEWVPIVSHIEVNLNNADTNGVGCERLCTFGGDKLNEKVVFSQTNKVFAYQATNAEMAKNHLAVIEIIHDGEYSIVNWYQFFKPRGFKGFMMKNIMMPKILQKALKNLEKRSVEEKK